jgi:hypothetical protein
MSTPTPPLTEKHALIYKEIAQITQKGIQLAFMQGVEVGFRSAADFLREQGRHGAADELEKSVKALPKQPDLS